MTGTDIETFGWIVEGVLLVSIDIYLLSQYKCEFIEHIITALPQAGRGSSMSVSGNWSSGVRALLLGVFAEQSVQYIWYYFSFFWSEQSACAALRRCSETK